MSTYELTREERKSFDRLSLWVRCNSGVLTSVPVADLVVLKEALSRAVGAAYDKSVVHTGEFEGLLVAFGDEYGPKHFALYSELRRIFPKKEPPKKLPGQVAYEAHVASMPGDVRELLADFHAAHSSTRTTYERIEAAVLATKAG